MPPRGFGFPRDEWIGMFTLSEVVPWGRSYDEYVRMFALTDADLSGRILGCGDGPAAFNAVATARGTRVVSCDPIYGFTATGLRQRIDETAAGVLEQTRINAGEFVWTSIRSVEELGALRLAAMDTFLADYEQGRREGRYVEASLPALPFGDTSFDLALCSHFLFLYTTQLGERFHEASIRELCRVAREVRIFPLLALGGAASPFVETNAASLRTRGFDVSIDTVPYEFQRGGNQMLRITNGELVSWRVGELVN